MSRFVLHPAFIITLIIFLSGCSGYNVKVDADPDSEFDRFETFGWLKTSRNIESFNRIDNERLTGLVHDMVDRIMEEKGYQKLDEGDPDMILTFYAGIKGPIDTDEQGYTYGKWYDRGKSVDQEGVLVIDIIDNERRVLIQRARGGTIVDDPEEAAKVVEKMIRDMFADFPDRQE